MVDEIPTDQRTADMQKCQVDVCSLLISDAQATVTVELRERALNDPPRSAEALAACNAALCDARGHVSLPQRLNVIGFVGVRLAQSLAGSAMSPPEGFNGVHSLKAQARVVDIGRLQRHREWDALLLYNQCAALWRIHPSFTTPYFFRHCQGIDRSTRPVNAVSFALGVEQGLGESAPDTAVCHSQNRRQQVIPEPQPISGGKYSHGSSVESTTRIPRHTSRFGRHGRPPRDFSGSGGQRLDDHSQCVRYQLLRHDAKYMAKIRFY